MILSLSLYFIILFNGLVEAAVRDGRSKYTHSFVCVCMSVVFVVYNIYYTHKHNTHTHNNTMCAPSHLDVYMCVKYRETIAQSAIYTMPTIDVPQLASHMYTAHIYIKYMCCKEETAVYVFI